MQKENAVQNSQKDSFFSLKGSSADGRRLYGVCFPVLLANEGQKTLVMLYGCFQMLLASISFSYAVWGASQHY